MARFGPPAFKPDDINRFFAFLKYPYTIRADAITAVGAPSSIGFLVKAVYWLYLTASANCLNQTSDHDQILAKFEKVQKIDEAESEVGDSEMAPLDIY